MLKVPAWEIGDRGFEPRSGIQVSKKQNVSFPLIQYSILWAASVTERYKLCSASNRKGSIFESRVWRAVSPHLSHHPQEYTVTI